MFRYIFYFLFSVLFLALIGFLGYEAYKSYMDYRDTETKSNSLATLSKISTLSSLLADEEFKSALFIGVKGVNYLGELDQSRKRVDDYIAKIKAPTETSPSNESFTGSIDTLASELARIRKSIDPLDLSGDKLFDGSLSEKLLKPLYSTDIINSKGSDYLEGFVNLLEGARHLADERSLLTSFVASHSILTKENMLAWEHIMGRSNSVIGSINGIKSNSFMPKLSEVNFTQNNSLDNLRGDIFEHSNDGKYETQLTQIEGVFAPYISTTRRTADLLSSDFKKQLADKKTDYTYRALQFIAAVLTLLVILFFALRFIKSAKQEKMVLEESLREIVSDLDEDQRKELELIIRRGDRTAVYRFMAKTTMKARAAEERALKAEKSKDLFLASMSHEIRTPLNGILGFTQLMLSTPLNSEQEEFMGVIEGSSDNLLKIVNDILDLSKIHANKIELESIPFSIMQHMEKAIEPHAARALEKGIEYSVFIDPSLPKILGDPTKLSQILANLVGNAVKFTNEGGTVDVNIRKIKEADGAVITRFSVKDSGIGIEPSQIEKIFEPFSQADTSTTREFGGTGLGLTITRDIIRYMGGELKVDSEPGKGSEFYFEISFVHAGDDENIGNKLDGVHVAYYHAGSSTLRQMERNLALYVRASGGRYRMVSDDDLYLMDDVDVLILDYTNKDTRDNLDKLLALGKKVILISTVTQKHFTDNLSSRIDRVVYRPVTSSKLIRAYENMDSKRGVLRDDSNHNVLLSGLKVLVAEDNHINQKLIARVLQDMGIEVTLVNNGKEAFELRSSRLFDAILMDIQMPVMGGVESTHKILESEYSQGHAHVPIIALTANALQGDREKYLKEGFDDYISKPINLDQLRHALSNAIKKNDNFTPPRIPVKEANANRDKNTSSRSILMFSSAGSLMKRIHEKALSVAGYTFVYADNIDTFLNLLKVGSPDYVLLDANAVAINGCELMEVVVRNGSALYIYGSGSSRFQCREEFDTYSSIPALLEKLK